MVASWMVLLLCCNAPASSPTRAAGLPMVLDAVDLPAMLAKEGRRVVLLEGRSLADFNSKRVENSRWLDSADWRNVSLASGGLAERGTWAARLASLGISPDSAVVVYDDGNMTDAARIWFLLQYLGVRRVAVLNGGFPELVPLFENGKLRRERGAVPITRLSVTQPLPRAAAGVCPVALADKDAVRSAMTRRDTVILDVRTPAEYGGTDHERNPRHGHLPNAVNIPHARLLVADASRAASRPAGGKPTGRLKSPDELREMFERAGIAPDDRVVVHCQSGGRAALGALALVYAGYGNVSNYYASFGEWSADASTPIIGPAATAPKP